MGGLVLTKGTRHLIEHLNKAFKENRLENLRDDDIHNQPGNRIRDAFANAGNDLCG